MTVIARITVEVAAEYTRDVATGDSIAVSGACLTAIPAASGVAFDVSRETLDCTTLGGLAPGSRVNLERSLTLANRLGGHLVSGHVDGIGEVSDLAADARSTRLALRLPPQLLRYVAAKGSLCVDGVSLTVNTVDDDRVGINLIPHTLEQTTLSQLQRGSKVNIEVDMIAPLPGTSDDAGWGLRDAAMNRESSNQMELDAIEDVIADLRDGRMVIVMDDEGRENEGDLILAGACATPEHINFMASYGRGLICLTLSKERCQQLRLPLMVADNRASHSTKFTVSIEAAEGVTTGISAADRATTIRAAVAGQARPEDLVQPGHVFPLMAEPGGVLTRAGHTEAGCDLARLAGFEPAAVIVEILNPDGSMARRPDLERFAREHGLKICSIEDLIPLPHPQREDRGAGCRGRVPHALRRLQAVCVRGRHPPGAAPRAADGRHRS